VIAAVIIRVPKGSDERKARWHSNSGPRAMGFSNARRAELFQSSEDLKILGGKALAMQGERTQFLA